MGMGKHAKVLYTIAFAAVAAWTSTIAVADGEKARLVAESVRPLTDQAALSPAVAIPAATMHVTDPAAALFAGTDAASSALGGTPAPSGTLAELSSPRFPLSYPARVSSAAPQAQAQVQEAREIAAIAGERPSGPLALLCALAVVLYIARRKLGLAAGDS
jgi:hypothetical protein